MATTTAVEVRESIDVRLLANLSENFRSPYEAIFELVDNALASRIDEPVTVTITGSSTRGGSLKVISKGGAGMGLDELRAFLRWGKAASTVGLNRYGQGGKAAIGYLGKGCRVRCNKHDERVAYVLEDRQWLSRPEGREKTFLAETLEAPFPRVGFVEIEVLELRRDVNFKRLERELGWRYRPALERRHLTLHVRKGRVRPASLPAETRTEFERSLEFKTEAGERVLTPLLGWVGIAPRGFEGRGGVRCNAHGRVVTQNEYFGHRTASFKASLNNLVGEVDLSFVPVVLNKNAFDTASPAWEAAQKELHRLLAPHVEALLRRKDARQPSDEERERAMEACDLAHRVLEEIAADRPRRGSSHQEGGRKPPQPRSGESKPSASATRERQPMPRTPPPANAVGRLRRAEGDVDWDVRPLDPKIRSARMEERGRTNVVINSEYPLYRERGGDLLYMLETGILEELRGDGHERLAAESYDLLNEALYAAINAQRRRGK